MSANVWAVYLENRVSFEDVLPYCSHFQSKSCQNAHIPIHWTFWLKGFWKFWKTVNTLIRTHTHTHTHILTINLFSIQMIHECFHWHLFSYLNSLLFPYTHILFLAWLRGLILLCKFYLHHYHRHCQKHECKYHWRVKCTNRDWTTRGEKQKPVLGMYLFVSFIHSFWCWWRPTSECEFLVTHINRLHKKYVDIHIFHVTSLWSLMLYIDCLCVFVCPCVTRLSCQDNT